MTAIGSASVAPYSERIRAAGAIRANLSSTRGNTGAPPTNTRSRLGRRTSAPRQPSASRSTNAGEASMVRGASRPICSAMRSVGAAAGRPRSASSSRLGAPAARFENTNSGMIGTASSPACVCNAACRAGCVAASTAWLRSTPFGRPVLPLVNVTIAVLSGAHRSQPSSGARRLAAASGVAPGSRRPVAKASGIARSCGTNQRSRQAVGVPTNPRSRRWRAQDAMSSRQPPGSTKTTTSPSRNAAAMIA